MITDIIKYGIVLVAVVVGIGIKIYFGDSPKEEIAEDIIERVVQAESGIDVKPLLDDKKE